MILEWLFGVTFGVTINITFVPPPTVTSAISIVTE